jgi:hypothetical protein
MGESIDIDTYGENKIIIMGILKCELIHLCDKSKAAEIVIADY